MNVVETKNITKWYGRDGNSVKAVDGVNLTIKEGEFVSVVGQSGSGKSTLLHLLGGVDRPTRGKVYIDGEDIYSYTEKKLSVLRRRKIGFIFQFYNLLPVLTAEENIVLPLLMDRKKPDPDYIDSLLNMLGLYERRNHLPSELSGGQQQRVSIGRALIYRPSIVFADEPTGNLDSKTSRDIIDLIKTTAKTINQTVMLVTHDRDLACEADRIITIEDGRVRSEGEER